MYKCINFSQGEYVYIDFETGNWNCTSDGSACPGGAVNGVGCPMPECDVFASNPYGTCECDGQFFINDECTEGFFCRLVVQCVSLDSASFVIYPEIKATEITFSD